MQEKYNNALLVDEITWLLLDAVLKAECGEPCVLDLCYKRQIWRKNGLYVFQDTSINLPHNQPVGRVF